MRQRSINAQKAIELVLVDPRLTSIDARTSISRGCGMIAALSLKGSGSFGEASFLAVRDSACCSREADTRFRYVWAVLDVERFGSSGFASTTVFDCNFGGRRTGATLPASPVPNRSTSNSKAKVLSAARMMRISTRRSVFSGRTGRLPSSDKMTTRASWRILISSSVRSFRGFRSGTRSASAMLKGNGHPCSVARTASNRRSAACPSKAGALAG